MDRKPPQWSRRDFLLRLGLTAGATPMYRAMMAMGIVAVPSAYAGAPKLPAESGKGKKVVIIGAGIGGLTAAYELGKAGYACTVLEATTHVGGRNRTVRRGDKLIEYDSEQVCEFDDDPHLYFNCGPARLPYHHQGVLSYCREFGVALEPFVNDNRAAYMHSSRAFGGKPQRQQKMATDSRGYIAELLTKAISRDSLDKTLGKDDADRMLEFLSSYGSLDAKGRYQGSVRAGPLGESGVLDPAQVSAPVPIGEFLKSGFGEFQLEFPEDWDMAATMMQPVGGMDMIVKGFERKLGNAILRGAPVTRILNREHDVAVRYKNPAGKGEQEIVADYCIDSAPAYIAAGFDNNFSPRYREALKALRPGKFFKIAFQGKRRFWEEDHQIYGGISWTDQEIQQLWYPPHAFHHQKGIMLGAYIWNPEHGERFGSMTPQQRLAEAIRQGEQIHPGYGELVEKGMSIAWHKVPYMLGCAPVWTEEGRAKHYPVLTQPEGRHYMIGDQISYLSGWQEAAVRSAHVVIEHIHGRVSAA